ncbi:MAG: hypothetical protein MMC33_001688 [Icmadophila ericetorum]|nr:hypothetical protein [Icmadophila ericetorum]
MEDDDIHESPLTLPALGEHTATVIIAHGLGDNGRTWMNLVTEWSWCDLFPHIKFIFPNAPSLPVTVCSGACIPAWFDIRSYNDLYGGNHDKSGIGTSRDYLNRLIENEIDNNIPSSRIIVGGFSQGGAAALFTGLASTHKLAGFFGLSSYLPMLPEVEDIIGSTALPRLLAHAFSPAEIADLGEFIEARLPSVQIPNRIRDELNEMRCQAVPTAASKLLAMRDPV